MLKISYTPIKYKHFLLIFFLIIISCNVVISQTNNNGVKDSSVRLSRYRFAIGAVSLLFGNNNLEFEHLFFNLNFRSSGFEKTSPLFKIKFAFESGANGLVVSERNFNNKSNFYLYFLPYAKFGPEIKLGKNLFLGSSLGLVLVSYEGNFFPLPFLGLNGYYLFELNKNFLIEIESGFHTTYSPNKLPYLVYFTIGLSLI